MISRRARRLLGPLAYLVISLAISGVAVADVLEPEVVNKKTFSESYTLIADLADEVYLQLQLAVSNVGASSRRGGCRALLVERGEPTWSESVQVSRGEWSYRPGDPPALQVGRCRLSGGERTELRAVFDARTVTLVLAAPIRPVRPLDKTTRIGADFYESDILVPWAPAHVIIEDRDGASRTLNGHGYADHSRSTTLPSDLAQRWVRFRGLAASGSTLLLARFPSDGGGVDGWFWRQGEVAPVALEAVRVTRLASSSGQWRMSVRSAAGADYEITTHREIHRHAPVEAFGFWGRMLRRFLGNPVTYTYRANLIGLPEGSETVSLQGIAEVTIVDE